MPGMGRDAVDARVMVGLLGPVEIGLPGGPAAPVAQPRLRVLLGLLAVAGGRLVSTEALVDGLWGEEWSPGREKNLHSLVYQLRRQLAALAEAWQALGLVHSRLGEHRQAISCYRQALARARAEDPDGPLGAGHGAGRIRRCLPARR
jgi:tetratricopeptide (TPR) repeat protein